MQSSPPKQEVNPDGSLVMDYYERRNEIKKLTKSITELSQRLYKLKQECDHKVRERKGQSYWCRGCLECLGWICKKDPTTTCIYPINDSDYCARCDQPGERK